MPCFSKALNLNPGWQKPKAIGFFCTKPQLVNVRVLSACVAPGAAGGAGGPFGGDACMCVAALEVPGFVEGGPLLLPGRRAAYRAWHALRDPSRADAPCGEIDLKVEFVPRAPAEPEAAAGGEDRSWETAASSAGLLQSSPHPRLVGVPLPGAEPLAGAQPLAALAFEPSVGGAGGDSDDDEDEANGGAHSGGAEGGGQGEGMGAVGAMVRTHF